MRTLFLSIILIAGTFFVDGADAVELFCQNDWTAGFSGYIQETYVDDASGDIENDRTRLRFDLNRENVVGVFTELEVSGLQTSFEDLRDSNWIQRSYLYYKTGETVFSVGRVFVSSGCSTYWPGGIITAKYPGVYPWNGYYAYGVEVVQNMDSWQFAGTASGDSSLKFNDGGQFDRPEFSGRLKRSVGKDGHVAVSTQLSDSFAIVGLEGGCRIADFNLSGGTFWTDDDPESAFSGLAQIEYLINDLFSVHQQMVESTSGDLVSTSGLGIRYKGFYLVGDYERNLDESEDAVQVGARFNW
jgi:hypothetical protein